MYCFLKVLQLSDEISLENFIITSQSDFLSTVSLAGHARCTLPVFMTLKITSTLAEILHYVCIFAALYMTN